MKKRRLGKSEFEISEISLGCMSLPASAEEARPVIETAIEHGINYFDTADLYDKGVNEEVVGECLKPYRDQVFIATKVGNVWNENGEGWHWDASKEHIEEGIKESLRRLKTDYIDLYQLHGGTIDDPWDDIIETFEKLKKEGLIREYGISSIRPNVFKPFFEKSNGISNMMQYSILDRRPEEWFPFFEEKQVSVVTRGSIAKGLLTDEWRRRVEKIDSYLNYSKAELISILEKIESEFGSVHPAAIAFNLSQPAVASLVVGARTKEQLLENLKAYEEAQHIRDISFMKTITKQEIYTEHR
ncbi:aldo/keto reductase [Ureibacillus sp. FSL K6-8385]|uniref:Aldo/keto reductase n=1 Tax=Ureibacillus terrenus TaxID=118246 RepID=A0A540V6N8_9BACL|nr:aldo/keto reductase [Ureibacillus terrenus]MED3660574.1 aldo/keto reductase [Ureibacillus terrenus]MED3762694.1 aldo/keto reductase [Ureibacillus terrenus]TQE92430.1 aldo/keto reductase [Ureibacillus terrenus]